MNIQNIISNKLDINWLTSFSYTGVQQFFSKSHSLHYVFRKQEEMLEAARKKLPKEDSSKKSEQNSKVI
jgi:hypothetical protein